MQRLSDEQARCWTCGYRLRGLEGTICPECGRAFDPNDPATFDRRPPGWRRRRTIRRSVILGIILLSGYGAYRQGRMLRGTITFTCINCGAKQTVYRWEPQAPRWLGVRFPGIHWRGRLWRPENETRPDCGGHFLGDVAVIVDFPAGGGGLVRVTCSPQDVPFLGGIDAAGEVAWQQAVTPENASDLLGKLMSPENFGASVSGPAKDEIENKESGP